MRREKGRTKNKDSKLPFQKEKEKKREKNCGRNWDSK